MITFIILLYCIVFSIFTQETDVDKAIIEEEDELVGEEVKGDMAM